MAKKRVLIADDDAEMRAEISEILTDEGYEVKTVADGQSVIKLVKKEKFDVLLLDLKMSGVTGFDVLKELNIKKMKMKVIVLTGSILGSSLPDEKSISYREKTRILKLADTVMNKPFYIVKLIEKVRQYTAA